MIQVLFNIIFFLLNIRNININFIDLHKFLYSFYFQLVKDFYIDLTHCLTLPQVTIEIFRTNGRFLKSDKIIRLLSNKHYKIFSQAYYGAMFNVFHPYGEKLYRYDINSLYPFAMLLDMPVGSPKIYDITKGLDNLFRFTYVKVDCSENIFNPFPAN